MTPKKWIIVFFGKATNPLSVPILEFGLDVIS
jgi:hypothetical protein